MVIMMMMVTDHSEDSELVKLSFTQYNLIKNMVEIVVRLGWVGLSCKSYLWTLTPCCVPIVATGVACGQQRFCRRGRVTSWHGRPGYPAVHWYTCTLVHPYHGSLEYLGMSPFNTVDPGTLVHAYPGTPVHSVMSPFNTANRSKLTRLTENRHQLGPFCAGNLSDNQAAALILLILHHNQTRVQVVQLYN